MSNDLEQQLDEMGPEYRAVVARLRAAQGAEDLRRETGDARRGFAFLGSGLAHKVSCLSSQVLWPVLLAASLLVIAGFAVVFRDSPTSSVRVPREYCASVDEMIATQNPDGSWKNDFLTRRNAEVLKACATPAATIAYKKAMRNLRVKGVL